MVHYHFNEQAASFKSSDTVLNKVWDLCKYTMKATSFAGLYVDGDRERIPYEADALINQLSHYAADNEFSLARRSHEYLITHATWPTEWILQSVLMAWNDYQYTGDERSIKKYYADLKAKLLLPLAREDGLISSRTGKQDKVLLDAIHFKGKQIRDIVDWPTSETDGFVFTNINSVVNAYHYRALILMTKMALVLGKNAEAGLLEKQAALVKESFQKKLIDPKTGLVKDGEGTDHSSLHANMFALAFDLVPAQSLPKVTRFLRSKGMDCSVYGAQFLMDALYQGGAADHALALLTSTNDRSWYNMLREGATMTMEAWGNKFKPNQDWNHAWGAVPANIIMRKLVGIECSKAGFEEINIKPELGGLSFISATLPTIKGTISVDIKEDIKSYWMKVEIPVNTKANIYLPEKFSGKTVLLNGKRIRIIKQGNSCFAGSIGSGTHIIKLL
jgi:alpha-L-rhamnosidase